MKRFIFYALDQYTLKVYRRKEWEAGVKHGVICEQQRIIELLSKKLSCCECDMNHFENDIANKAIALIKGENK